MSQGRPEKAGTKHSIYRHLNTESGYYTVDEIALIPQIIAEGSRDVSDKKRYTQCTKMVYDTELLLI